MSPPPFKTILSKNYLIFFDNVFSIVVADIFLSDISMSIVYKSISEEEEED